MKKTKIVCTIGPSSDSEEMLRALFKAGLNVCRLNFSHGTHKEHQVRIDRIKKVREELELPIAIMLDTKGPEIRLKQFANKSIHLKREDKFTITTRDVTGDQTICSVTYQNLAREVSEGDRILVDDGLMELRVESVKDDCDILCTALTEGDM